MMRDPAAVFAEGAAALEAEDFDVAERIFSAMAAQDPAAHDVWNALAVVALRAGSPDIALGRARRALELDRRNALYINNFGIVCGELGQFAEAEQAFRRALKLKPAYAEAHFNLGKSLHKQGRLGDALEAYKRAYRIAPQWPGVRVSLAEMHRAHGDPRQAMQVLREASVGELESPKLLVTFLECLADLEGPERAVEQLRALLERRPDHQVAHYLLSVMLLSLGCWREGWRHYLWRTHRAASLAQDGVPACLPQRLDGMRILLRGEQGIGDILFFLRYASELRDRGAAIGVSCPPKLRRLLENQEGLLAAVAEDRADAGQAGFHLSVWAGDLPTLLDSDATPPAFVLTADAGRRQRARETLARLGAPPYLGVTWRAGTDVLRRREFGNERGVLSKEVPPQALGETVRGWRGTLVCLQRDPAAGEREALSAAAAAPVHDLSALNEDLEEMLAVLSLLDEHVAVSNTNIHLLAGIGGAARVLVPYPGEWRWMRGGGGSPWFPGFQVYRQPVSRDWAEPLARLRAELLA